MPLHRNSRRMKRSVPFRVPNVKEITGLSRRVGGDLRSIDLNAGGALLLADNSLCLLHRYDLVLLLGLSLSLSCDLRGLHGGFCDGGFSHGGGWVMRISGSIRQVEARVSGERIKSSHNSSTVERGIVY